MTVDSAGAARATATTTASGDVGRVVLEIDAAEVGAGEARERIGGRGAAAAHAAVVVLDDRVVLFVVWRAARRVRVGVFVQAAVVEHARMMIMMMVIMMVRVVMAVARRAA